MTEENATAVSPESPRLVRVDGDGALSASRASGDEPGVSAL